MAELHVWLAEFAVNCIGKDGPIFFDAGIFSHNHFLSTDDIYVPEGEDDSYAERVLETLENNDNLIIGKKGAKITKEDVKIFLEKLRKQADREIFANGRTYASPSLYGKGKTYTSESTLMKTVKKIAKECNISEMNKLYKQLETTATALKNASISYSRSVRSDSVPNMDTVYENVYQGFTRHYDGNVVDRTTFITCLKKYLRNYFESAFKKQYLFEDKLLDKNSGQVADSDNVAEKVDEKVNEKVDDGVGEDSEDGVGEDSEEDRDDGAEHYSISWSS